MNPRAVLEHWKLFAGAWKKAKRSSNPKAVHDLRVETRRLTALLALRRSEDRAHELSLRSGQPPTDHRPKQVAIPVVHELDCRILLQCPQDSISEAAIREYLRRVRGQDRVAHVRITAPNIRDRQIVRQVTGADDLDTIVKPRDANRGVHSFVATVKN